MVPKWDQKSISTLKAENQLNVSRLAFSWLSGVEVGSKNRAKIDPKLESKTGRMLLRSKNAPRRPKTSPRRPRDAPRCRKTLPRCPQDAPRRTQAAPRRPQDDPKRRPTRSQEAPKRRPRGAQDGPQDTPKRNPLQTSILERFGVDFAPFWNGFLKVLGLLLGVRGLIFLGF